MVLLLVVVVVDGLRDLSDRGGEGVGRYLVVVGRQLRLEVRKRSESSWLERRLDEAAICQVPCDAPGQ